jgi:hypothetical protein
MYQLQQLEMTAAMRRAGQKPAAISLWPDIPKLFFSSARSSSIQDGFLKEYPRLKIKKRDDV